MSKARKYDPMAMLDIEKARKQARLNKQRADRMERDIAAYLTRGRQQIARRTPQSGAGWIKGDNHVPLPSAPDFFLISCKMSQAQTPDNRAYIKFSVKWVDEMRRDVDAMQSIGCKFGIIVIRYFGRAKGELFSLIDIQDIPLIEKVLNLKLTPGEVINKDFKKNGQPLRMTKFFRDDMLENINKVYRVNNADLMLVNLSTVHEALLEADKLYMNGEYYE